MERWINETAYMKKDALTIFFISSFIGIWAAMRKWARVREFGIFIN